MWLLLSFISVLGVALRTYWFFIELNNELPANHLETVSYVMVIVIKVSQ